MTYKQFRSWCSDRAADGCWGPISATRCILIINVMEKLPFWKRRKAWKEIEPAALAIVQPLDEKFQEMRRSNHV